MPCSILTRFCTKFYTYFRLTWNVQDFPDDVTGNLDTVKEFIKSDSEMCKWIGLSFVSIQVK